MRVFHDFNMLWIRSITSSPKCNRQPNIKQRSSPQILSRYLTCCFVCSSVLGYGDKSRLSTQTSALWIDWCFCGQVFPPGSLTLSPGFWLFTETVNSPSPQTLFFPNTGKDGEVINDINIPVERCSWLHWWQTPLSTL